MWLNRGPYLGYDPIVHRCCLELCQIIGQLIIREHSLLFSLQTGGQNATYKAKVQKSTTLELRQISCDIESNYKLPISEDWHISQMSVELFSMPLCLNQINR